VQATLQEKDSLTISEFADLFGFPAQVIIDAIHTRSTKLYKPYYTFKELALRWNCTPQHVYNVVRDDDTKVVYLGKGEKRGKPQLAREVVARIERQSPQLLER
jgi:hypothetical protein